MEKKVYCIKEFCERYGISRSHLYRQIRAGHLRVVKRGYRTFISPAAAERWFRTAPYNQSRKALAYCCDRSSKRNTRRRKTLSFGGYFKLIFRKWK